jgi:hypothetical protein
MFGRLTPEGSDPIDDAEGSDPYPETYFTAAFSFTGAFSFINESDSNDSGSRR